MRQDMVAFVNWPTYGLCCFTTGTFLIVLHFPLQYIRPSLGYFLYDAADIVLARRIMEKWDILLHHMTVSSFALWDSSSSYKFLLLDSHFGIIRCHVCRMRRLSSVRDARGSEYDFPTSPPNVSISRYRSMGPFSAHEYLRQFTYIRHFPMFPFDLSGKPCSSSLLTTS